MAQVRRTRAVFASATLLTFALVAVLLGAPGTSTASAAGAAAAGNTPVSCGDVTVAVGHVRCFSTISPVPSARIHAFGTTTTRTEAWTPQDIADLYDLPAIPATVEPGTGPLVAVVEAGGMPADEDLATELATYRDANGLGACGTADGCLTIVDGNGSTTHEPAAIDGWDFETVMDVEAVAAACPTCRVLVVQAESDASDDIDAAIATAASRSSYVSMSFGYDDAGMTRSEVSSTEAIFAAHPDVTFVASSGDFGWSTYLRGYEDCGRQAVYTGGATASCTEYPSSSPHVISAGGTQATESITDSGTSWSQAVWNPGKSASASLNGGGPSSGCSSWTGMTPAQALNARAKAACKTARGTADLSAIAAGFLVDLTDAGTAAGTDTGQWLGGGTSLAAPLLTAMYARAGNHTSPSDVYARANADPAAFTDVTSGDTRGCAPASDTLHLCSAGTGWDGPTGLGTPHGLASLAVFDGTTTPVDQPTSQPTGSTTDQPTTTAEPTITAAPTQTAAPVRPPTTGTTTTTLRPIRHSGKIKVSGKARVRARLKAAYGTFDAGTTSTVTWLVNGKPVAHGKHLRVKRAWLKHRIRYVVTTTGVGRAPLTLTSPMVKVKR